MLGGGELSSGYQEVHYKPGNCLGKTLELFFLRNFSSSDRISELDRSLAVLEPSRGSGTDEVARGDQE